MSVGCALVASNTPPVQEVVINAFNAELVDFFDHQELADKVTSLINDPEKRNLLSKNARQTIVDSYDLENVCLPKQINWVQNLYEKSICYEISEEGRKTIRDNAQINKVQNKVEIRGKANKNFYDELTYYCYRR
jgi:hypothetical protein